VCPPGGMYYSTRADTQVRPYRERASALRLMKFLGYHLPPGNFGKGLGFFMPPFTIAINKG
jgi:hypothetical protein